MRIENLLGKNLYTLCLGEFSGPQLVWYHLPITANNDDEIVPYGDSFSHLIYKEGDGAVSPLHTQALNILLHALDREGEQLTALYRIRLGLVTRTPHPVVYPGHIDDDRPHKTGLYYVLDSDGDTIVYNEKRRAKSQSEYTVLEQNTPVANSWFSFDGTHYHSATSPTAHDRRIVITYNYQSR